MRPYSVRFFQQSGAGVTRSYVVPPGKRAIVRGVNAYTNAPEGGVGWFLAIAGTYVMAYVFQAGERAHFQEVRCVAYGGEEMLLQTYGSNMQAHASGFLFEDTSGGEAYQGEDYVGQLPSLGSPF